MFNSLRKICVFTMTSMLAIVSTGCGADSVQDTLNQERDRQRQMAGALAREYKQIAGSYTTTQATNKTSVNSFHYFVLAQIDLKYVQKDTSSVPQPYLFGSFRMFSKKMLDASASKSVSEIATSCDEADEPDPNKCGILTAFSMGIYDLPSKTLAIHIPGYGVLGADVSCEKKSDGIFDCKWELASGSSNGFNFTIVKSL